MFHFKPCLGGLKYFFLARQSRLGIAVISQMFLVGAIDNLVGVELVFVWLSSFGFLSTR